jgi:translation initiation factor IF-3
MLFRTAKTVVSPPRNKEIASERIYLIDSSGSIDREPKRRDAILKSLDPSTHYLLQVKEHNMESGFEFPLCKIVAKSVDLEKQKSLAKAKKTQKAKSVIKEIKLTWYTAKNDIAHRLKKATKSLLKGEQVQIVISYRSSSGRQKMSKAATLTREARNELVDEVNRVLSESGTEESGMKQDGNDTLWRWQPFPKEKRMKLMKDMSEDDEEDDEDDDEEKP